VASTLGPSDYYLFHAHEHIDGVPKLSHLNPVLDKCPTCIQAKQSKKPAGRNTTRVAARPYQGLSIDFAFAGVNSQDDKRKENFAGINCETCWILVSDHFSRTLLGGTRVSKGPPIEWLRAFLEEYEPRSPGNYVYFDQGGELMPTKR
jgi:hypothetical protein